MSTTEWWTTCFRIIPYKAQDNYDRELHEKEQITVVLENDYIKAIFLPQFGGKLYFLFDKVEQKELLFVNSVVRPCHHPGNQHIYGERFPSNQDPGSGL